MKALSIWQPYAQLIAMGVKQIETRSWGTPYRGLVAIHAAARKEGLLEALAEVNLTLPIFGQPTLPACMPLGAVVAVAELLGCAQSRGHADGRFPAIEHELGNLQFGRWAWCFRNIQPLIPAIPVRGNQGLWNLPLGVEDRILAVLRVEPAAARPTCSQLTLF